MNLKNGRKTEKEWLAARDDENETSSQLRSKTRRHNVLVYHFDFDFAVPNAAPSYLAGHHTGGVGTTAPKETAASESAATLLRAMSYGKPKELIMSDVEKPSAKEKAPAANWEVGFVLLPKAKIGRRTFAIGQKRVLWILPVWRKTLDEYFCLASFHLRF